jgi:hypothetical protein
MKRHVALCFVLYLFSLSAIAQERAKTQEDRPSLDETVDWLRGKLPTYANTKNNDGKMTTTDKIEDLVIDRCDINYTYLKLMEANSLGMSSFVKAKVRFALADMDADDVRVQKEKDYYQLLLICTEKKQKVRLDITARVLGSNAGDRTDYADHAKFPFEDSEMAERVAKAFRNAITLCKKKKEPF